MTAEYLDMSNYHFNKQIPLEVVTLFEWEARHLESMLCPQMAERKIELANSFRHLIMRMEIDDSFQVPYQEVK